MIIVDRDIKADVLLASISGGTDIIACFMGENSTLPVYRGEIQVPAPPHQGYDRHLSWSDDHVSHCWSWWEELFKINLNNIAERPPWLWSRSLGRGWSSSYWLDPHYFSCQQKHSFCCHWNTDDTTDPHYNCHQHHIPSLMINMTTTTTNRWARRAGLHCTLCLDANKVGAAS